jgi:hypothetical protein
MHHRNAPLAPVGRRRLVALVEEEHLTFEVDGPHLGDPLAAGERGRAPDPRLPAGPLLGAAPAAVPDGRGDPRPRLRGAPAHRLGGAADRLRARLPHATVSRCLGRRGLGGAPLRAALLTACRWLTSRVLSCTSWWSGAASPTPRRRRSGAGRMRTRSSPGGCAPGSFPAIPTSPPRPAGCSTSTPGALRIEPASRLGRPEVPVAGAGRRRRTLPPIPGGPLLCEFEYCRGGTLAYLAYLAAWEVHDANLFGRIEEKAGIEPFGRLAEEVIDGRTLRLGEDSVLDRRQRLLPRRSVLDRPSRGRLREPAPDSPADPRLLAQPDRALLLDCPAQSAHARRLRRARRARLLDFPARYEEIARPFEWTFNRLDLERVSAKVADREPELTLAT